MKKLFLVTLLFCAVASTQTFAQGGQQRDPKKMSEMLAKKLDFTDAQNTQLADLNKKYTGDDYDMSAYREDFKKILTDEQKQELEELRQKRMGNGRRGGVN